MIMRWMMMWLNWSVATINATLQLLDIIYIYIYIIVNIFTIKSCVKLVIFPEDISSVFFCAMTSCAYISCKNCTSLATIIVYYINV